MTLGSLFDGIGGFPLAAEKIGITPLWASEIEAAPISITKKHFPNMKHFGDIKILSGEKLEPVDVITFGSPCQDLSIAGNREGLSGERSGLFMEAVRIIKEMRYATNGVKPRFAVWENVHGAFSSNKGEDFRIVIEEIAKVNGGGHISIPRPPARDTNKDTFWEYAGTIVGDGWSLAWRVLDAQYWGVPQRRRRIFLIADFASECAAEILFKPDGVFGNITESEEPREGVAEDSGKCVKAAGFNGFRSASGTIEYAEDRAPCIQANMPPNAVIGVDGYNQNITGDVAQTLRGGRSDGDNVGLIIVDDQGGERINVESKDIAPYLRSEAHGNLPLVCSEQYTVDFGRVADRIQMNADKAVTLQAEGGGAGAKTGLYCLPVSVHQNQCGEVRVGEVVNTLNTNSNATGRNAPLIMTDNEEAVIAYDCRNNALNIELSATLQAKENGGQSLNYINPVFTFQKYSEYKEAEIGSTLKSNGKKDASDLVRHGYAVRRLTPLECERLQGFPDYWTEYGYNNKQISDSARYKALGNSLALPCVIFVLTRIKEALCRI